MYVLCGSRLLLAAPVGCTRVGERGCANEMLGRFNVGSMGMSLLAGEWFASHVDGYFVSSTDLSLALEALFQLYTASLLILDYVNHCGSDNINMVSWPNG